MNTNTDTIPVWDPGVRIFHWSLVATFALSYFSGEMHELHTWSGYAVIALLGFRLIWGVRGGRHARFADFIYSPRTVWRYLKRLAAGDPPHYLGHNPAGGWMIALMLLTLILVCYSGLEALAQEGDGPLADYRIDLIASAHAHGNESHQKSTTGDKPTAITQETTAAQSEHLERAENPTPLTTSRNNRQREEFWSTLHHQLVNLMLLLIAIHLGGVLVSSLAHRENLVRAMITGRKQGR